MNYWIQNIKFWNPIKIILINDISYNFHPTSLNFFNYYFFNLSTLPIIPRHFHISYINSNRFPLNKYQKYRNFDQPYPKINCAPKPNTHTTIKTKQRAYSRINNAFHLPGICCVMPTLSRFNAENANNRKTGKHSSNKPLPRRPFSFGFSDIFHVLSKATSRGRQMLNYKCIPCNMHLFKWAVIAARAICRLKVQPADTDGLIPYKFRKMKTVFRWCLYEFPPICTWIFRLESNLVEFLISPLYGFRKFAVIFKFSEGWV